MEQDEVVNRLKGLGRGPTPPPPDFTAATQALQPASTPSRSRLGIGPIVAVVGVLALGTAALAVPDGAPLRQVGASVSGEIDVETDATKVDVDADADDSGGSASLAASPCEGPPPVPTTTTVEGVEAGAAVEVSEEDRAAQVEAWNEWRAENCGPEANGVDDDDDAEGDEDSDDDSDEGSDGDGQGRPADKPGHPHEGDPCHGPPPHSNKPGTGDPERDEAQRKAEQEAWHQWHHENCPPGQTGDHPNSSDHNGGRPEGAGKPEDSPSGRPDGAGKPEGTPDRGDGE